MLMFVQYVSVHVYCHTNCGECLVRGSACLLNGQHLIPWARVCRVEMLVIASSLLLLTCVHSDMCIYIYIDIFSFVVE